MDIFCILMNSAALLWGGAVDFRRREIPNAVPLTLLLTGIVGPCSLFLKLLMMLCMAFILGLSAKIAKSNIPGGDYKLLCALTFSAGVPLMLGTLALAGIGAVLWGLATGKPFMRRIPLCSYIAPAYMVASACLLTIFFHS